MAPLKEMVKKERFWNDFNRIVDRVVIGIDYAYWEI